ncbi:MAG: HAD family hydrolase [Bacteroidetes bacterium]|nr:HAD family hydrolase [Bacteroidota bacterium]
MGFPSIYHFSTLVFLLCVTCTFLGPANIRPRFSGKVLGVAGVTESLQVQPHDCWYVGDDIVDMIAATKANVKAIGVTTGKYSSIELKANGADLVISSFNPFKGVTISI